MLQQAGWLGMFVRCIEYARRVFKENGILPDGSRVEDVIQSRTFILA